MQTSVKSKTKTTPSIDFKAPLFKISEWTILRLPEAASQQLPSRGQVMVEGTINGQPLQTPLEPDGNGSHWFGLDKKLLTTIHAGVGDTVALEITPMKTWPEPEVPADLQISLQAAPEAHALWDDVTPMAHWEWIRWIRSTDREETRQRRIEVGISKLKSGKRRPCCWNRNLCTEPSISKNGVLLTLDK